MDKVQLLEANYLTNFNLPNFSAKKGEEPRAASQKDFTEAHETRFMLIYAVYRRLLYSKNIESPTELDLAALEEVLNWRNIPVSLVSFKADKFSGTLRPNYFEQFNHFKFTVRLIAHLEKQGVNFQSLLQSLLFQHRSERSSKNSYRLARRFRNTVIDKVMKAQSVLPDFENLFFWCYLYLNSPNETDQKEARYKNFKTLSDFLTFYEPILYKNMEKEALTSLQTRAVNLGKSIGMSALNFEDGDRRSNAKQARSYMVHLHKARTAEQFREAIIRFQKKYGIIVANQLLESEDMNDDQNFVFIKQFTVMAALNILNGAFNPILQTLKPHHLFLMKNVNSITITYLSKVSFASLNGADKEVDNINPIKKITLANGTELPYVSAQALRRAMRDRLADMGFELSPIQPPSKTKGAVKTTIRPEEFIDDDLFGYMDAAPSKEEKGRGTSTVRTSPIRVEALVALTDYKGDMDYGTNYMGKGHKDASGADMQPNIFETEIHSGIYRGTILIELDRIGAGQGFESGELAAAEKCKRTLAFLDAFRNLWSSGRQTRFLADISPKFLAAQP